MVKKAFSRNEAINSLHENVKERFKPEGMIVSDNGNLNFFIGTQNFRLLWLNSKDIILECGGRVLGQFAFSPFSSPETGMTQLVEDIYSIAFPKKIKADPQPSRVVSQAAALPVLRLVG